MFDFLKDSLKKKKKQKLYREIILPEGIDFTSNDYLNLSSHSFIRKKMIQALEKDLPLSSKASRLLGGANPLHREAEAALKEFISRPAVLSFSSGYQANLGIIPALSKNRVVFSDEFNHASLIDGIRLGKSPYHIFRHNDLDHLEDLLQQSTEDKLIVTESLFSMEGDFCPLKEISDLAVKYGALLIVDEAHSTGLFGKNFGGRVSDLKQKNHIVSIHTGGKAMGSSGAFVGSSLLIKNYLINHCRSFIYSTAPPPLLMIQWLAVLQVLKKEKQRALKLREKALQFRKKLSLRESESPIVFFVLKGAEEALRTAQTLRDQGFFIQAVRTPTVPMNRQGLRVILHYDHTWEQLDRLRQSLSVKLGKQ